MVYKLRENSIFTGKIDPQKCGQRIEQLESRGTLVTPTVIVAEAQSTSSPFHDAFEWDETKAAEAHRLHQARQLLASIVIERANLSSEASPGPIRAFVNIRATESAPRHYESVERALSNAEKREILVQEALAALDSWKLKYRSLVELRDLFTALETEQEKLANKKKRTTAAGKSNLRQAWYG